MKTFRQIRMANIVRLFLVVSVALLVLLGLPGCGQTYSLSTSVSPSGSGSVSPSSGTYDTGKNVTLIATPASGYQFVSWSGDASGTNATTTITMNSSKHVIASFVQVWTISDQIVSGGYYVYLPSDGAYVNASSNLSLSWSADGSLDCFILTENQFNNFKQLGYALVWMASGSGSSGTISAPIQNSDTYYGVVRNTFTLGSSIKLYQATLTKY